MNQVIGLVTMLFGLYVTAQGPVVFRSVTGSSVPTASAEDSAAMVVWAGIAFARAFGAALLLLGSVLWAVNRDVHANRRDSLVPFVAAVSATFVLWAQQKAIWTTKVGFIFVALIGVIAISAGAELARSRRTRT